MDHPHFVEDGQMERHLYTTTNTWPYTVDKQAPWGGAGGVRRSGVSNSLLSFSTKL